MRERLSGAEGDSPGKDVCGQRTKFGRGRVCLCNVHWSHQCVRTSPPIITSQSFLTASHLPEPLRPSCNEARPVLSTTNFNQLQSQYYGLVGTSLKGGVQV